MTYTLHRRAWTLNAERSGSGHGHWSKTRQVTKEWRESFWALGVNGKQKFNSAHIVVSIEMRPPLADTGNHYGAVKAAIDGLVDAGVLPDDTPKTVRSLTMMAPRKIQKGERETFSITLIAADSNTCALCKNPIRGEAAHADKDHTTSERR